MELNVSQCRLKPDGTTSKMLKTAADRARPAYVEPPEVHAPCRIKHGTPLNATEIVRRLGLASTRAGCRLQHLLSSPGVLSKQ